MKAGDSITVKFTIDKHLADPNSKENGVIMGVFPTIAYSKRWGDALILVNARASFILSKEVVARFQQAGHEVIPKIEKYINEHALWVSISLYNEIVPNKLKSSIVANRSPGMSYIDGAKCSKCQEFVVYANDGFTCWSCKQDPLRSTFRSID